MAVSLAKRPKLLLFLAITTNAGTPDAKVHRLALTHDDGYDELVNELHDQTRATPGAELHCVIANDSSSGYTAAAQGDSSEELFSAWIEQQRIAGGL